MTFILGGTMDKKPNVMGIVLKKNSVLGEENKDTIAEQGT